MKGLFWNVRGFSNQPSRLALKKLTVSHKLVFCFIVEPWMMLYKTPLNFFTILNLKLFTTNDRPSLPPNLWCFCDTRLKPGLISSSNQHVAFNIKDGTDWFGMVVTYASINYIKRMGFWKNISTLKNLSDCPWSYISDFNTILGDHEHRGSSNAFKILIEDF